MHAAGATKERQGFSGAIAGLTFSDVIQLKGLNRFSGCVTVEFGEEMGKIYFRDGELVHAEQGGETGKAAFHGIFQWPNGNFHTYPNVSCTSHTIDISWKFLLMEAHQLLDEGKLSYADSPQSAACAKEVPMANEKGGAGISRQMKEVGGVVDAVLHTREGLPLEGASYGQETLAANASFLVECADRLGEVFGIGAVRSAAVEAEAAHLLLFESKKSYLTMTIDPKRPLGEVEASVRAAVASRRQVKAC
jgi:predicted regulator of Ras-like GTPase activity (Roadblock/LC7/MglB family)